MEPTRKGKIARCPPHIREEVCRRLHEGQPASKILPWLNSHAEVLKVLDEYFGEEPVTPQNLSEWRKGGYADWLKRRQRVAQLGELAKYAAQLGEAAGGNVNDGSAAILGGRILETLETALEEPAAGAASDAEGEGKSGVDLEGLVDCVVKLRASDLDVKRSKQRDRLLDQRERAVQLAERQFQVKTAEAFLKWYEDKRAQEIVAGKGTSKVKVEELRQLMFGADAEFTPKALNE